MALYDRLLNIQFILYLTAFAAFSWTLYYDFRWGQPPKLNIYITKLLWLTQIDLLIQVFYYGVGVMRGLGTLSTKEFRHDSTLAKLHNYLFATFAFPIGATVTAMFWILYNIDPDVVISLEAKPYLAIRWFNHMVHTAPAAFAILDMLIFFHQRPKVITGIVSLFVFTVVYVFLIIMVHRLSGYWAYPLLAILDFWQRGAFILAVSAFLISLYAVGAILHRIVWGKARADLIYNMMSLLSKNKSD